MEKQKSSDLMRPTLLGFDIMLAVQGNFFPAVVADHDKLAAFFGDTF